MANFQISDAELVQNYISGDEKAFATLLKRHQSKIYSFIYDKVCDKDLTDDIFQEAFVKIIKSLKSGCYAESGKFLSWAMRIAHNEVMNHFREQAKMSMKRDKDNFSAFDFIKDKTLSIEDVFVNDNVETNLLLLIDKLPEGQKEVLKLRFYEGKSFKETAEISGMSLNTALGTMRYAIKNIKKLIKKHKIDVTEYNIL